MRETADILIIGGGPGGLACATLLAQHGARVVLVERKAIIGPKICAGGITWNGLLKFVPSTLIERAFPEQFIITRRQHIVVAEQNPIIATICRERLGQWMAAQAREAGVTILTHTRAQSVAKHQAVLVTSTNRQVDISYNHLVGADGANSLVRRFLGLPTDAMGVGLNCMLPGQHPHMEWHLDNHLFGSGYGWIFPHADIVSIGAYGHPSTLSALMLKKNLLLWSRAQGFRLDPAAIRAGLVNFDYRGVHFDRTWLVGDAAGLASGLTGEGIYPALISGQAVARKIIDPACPAIELIGLEKKHRRHRRMITLARMQPLLCNLMMEMLVVLLRLKMLDFHTLEMAE